MIQFFIKYKYLFFLFIFALLASFPLFHIGLIPTHDGEYHLIRFYEFDKMLRSGNFYPRWTPDLNFGYGIPLLTYVYPLPNYFASLLHLFGISFLDSVKLNMAAASFVGSFFFYFWSKRFWGNLGGVVASVFYTFSPYHFVDIYVRGSVGEVWALGIFPGFLWAITEFSQTKKPVYAISAVIFLALTIFAHNILGLMFFFFAITYMAFLMFQEKMKIKLLLSFGLITLLALSLSAIFWLPALTETKYVVGLQVYDILHNFPDITQLLFPSWGTDFFGSGSGNEMSVQIGIMNLFAVFLGIYALLVYWKKGNRQTVWLLAFFLGWFVLLFYLMMPESYPVWKTFPLIHYFQFPWRLLSLTILVCSFFAGSFVSLYKNFFVGWILAILAIILTISYTTPAYYMVRSDQYYVSRSNFIDGTNSVGNVFNTIWNTQKKKHSSELFLTGNNQAVTNIKKISPTDFSAVIATPNKIEQQLAISYFPGWNVQIDAKWQKASQKDGLIGFSLPKGKHTIKVKLDQTNIEFLASIITLLSLGILFILFLMREKLYKQIV